MPEANFTWVETHKGIVDFLRKNEHQQSKLIDLLRSLNINVIIDKESEKGPKIALTEIDPFTFFCLIHKHRAKRIGILQNLARLLKLDAPSGDAGLPTSQALSSRLFPYKYERENEIEVLWDFFNKALNDELTEKDFKNALSVKNIAATKLSELLFYILPEKYLPINGPTKPYIEQGLGLNSEFNSLTEYNMVLKQIKSKTQEQFYELSFNAWNWAKDHKTSKDQKSTTSKDQIVFSNILSEVEKLIRQSGFSFHNQKDTNSYVWIKGPLNVIGNKEAHYEIIRRKKSVYVELHFENKKSHTYFHSKMPALPQKLKWFEWHGGGQSITSSQHDISTDGLASMLASDLFALEDAIGDEVRQHMGTLNKKYSLKKAYTTWLQGEYGSESQTVSSYVKAIEILSNVLSKNIFLINDQKFLSDLYSDLITRQKDPQSKYNIGNPPSYGKHGFYSASINSYIDFLSDRTIMSNPKVTQSIYPLNTILYGPPGTGKTYKTIKLAAEIIQSRKIGDYKEAMKVFNENLHGQIEFITFHQNYSYEDFIQGLRPTTDNADTLVFQKKDGIFKQLADRALENLIASNREPEELSNEARFNEAIELFAEQITESEETIPLTEAAYVFDAEPDAFRYTGNKWGNSSQGLRMKFSDLREFYRNNVKSRKDIKSLTNISGLANQHKSYYFKVYEKLVQLIPKKIAKPIQEIQKNYVIIIDEINRANISRVFGELITLIEPDKRSHGETPLKAKLPSGDSFTVPSNLYIIGTMNTADKSIALLDIALRRRFNFEAMFPLDEIPSHTIYDVEVLKKINKEIIATKGHDFQIGHSYFMNKDETLTKRMNNKVVPLLMEYYMNDKDEVCQLLKKAGLVVDENSWPLEVTGKVD